MQPTFVLAITIGLEVLCGIALQQKGDANTMNAQRKDPQTFPQRLQQLMDEHNPPFDLKELADVVGCSYEHARKMLRGITLPSKFLLQAIARVFDVDESELEAVVRATRFQKEYGTDAPGSVFNPEVLPFATAWPVLTDIQKSQLLSQLKKFVSANSAKLGARKA